MNTDDNLGHALPAAVQIPESGLLLDLGPRSRNDLNQLRQGQGRLCEHVAAVIEGARDDLGIPGDVEIVPVVLIYRRSDQSNGYTVRKVDRS